MRTGSIFFLFGILLVLGFPQLPSVYICLLLPVAAVLALIFKYFRWPAWVLFGFLWTLLRADLMLSENLDKSIEGIPVTVEGRIVSLPSYSNTVTRFELEMEHLTTEKGVKLEYKGKLRLSWYRSSQVIMPGQYWSLKVKLKRPYGFMNPGGFDYESWLFQKKIIATGYVIKGPETVLIRERDVLSIHYLRFQLRKSLNKLLDNRAVRSLITALAIGDRSSMTEEQWRVMTHTGTSHLLAISGLHIGLVAGLVFLITRWVWPLFSSFSRCLPVNRVAAFNSVFAALIYAALAGFSVPTQRAMLMLSISLILLSINRSSRATDIIALALFVVLLIDPFSAMSVGFWLSFAAISIIIYGMRHRVDTDTWWWKWGRVQCLLALGLMPLLVLWFQQIPLLSLVANCVAIPWISLLTVPLILSGSLLMFLSESVAQILLELSATSLELLWGYLRMLSNIELAIVPVASPSALALITALLGVGLLLMPRGLPGRWLGAFWLLPLVFPLSNVPETGHFKLTVLDVGQGHAAIVQTKKHTLIYDSGPSYGGSFNAGSGIIRPFLMRNGIKSVDTLVQSHGDSDHIGGIRGLLSSVKILNILSSVPDKIDHQKVSFCEKGQSWQWDEVRFEVLHPQKDDNLQGNNLSCVVRISQRNYSALLTGDIEYQAEQRLVREFGHKLNANVLIAPHHGSRTSSSAAFIDAVDAEYVIFPVGYRNRFGFPKEDIIDRYHKRKIKTLDTARSGAIEVYTDKMGMNVTSYRQRQRRFWHTEF